MLLAWLNECFRLDVIHFEKLAELTKAFTKNKLLEKSISLEEMSKEIDKSKSKRLSILEKNIEGIISNEFCKEQIQIIDFGIYELQQKVRSFKDPEINYECLLQLIRKLMFNPAELWENATPEERVKLQWFYFPKGIEFDGNYSRTNDICILYKLKKSFCYSISQVVTPRPGFPNW